jgi:hypothetical protein
MTRWRAVESMNYCKSNLKTGNPIVVEDLLTKKRTDTDKWSFEGFDSEGNKVKLMCEYIEGKKDKSGARVKLLKYIEEK